MPDMFLPLLPSSYGKRTIQRNMYTSISIRRACT